MKPALHVFFRQGLSLAELFASVNKIGQIEGIEIFDAALYARKSGRAPQESVIACRFEESDKPVIQDRINAAGGVQQVRFLRQ